MDSSRDIVRKLRENRILNERKDYEGMEQEELIKLAKDGDQLAFSTLINQNDEFFYKMTKKYVPEGTFDRDDILQIAEIAFWEAVQKWDGTGDFEAYAGMVVKRRLTDEYRKLQTDKVIANRNTKSIDSAEDDGEEEGPGEMSKSEFDSWMSNSHRSAEDEYIDQATIEEITKFFQTEMTDIERKLIRLYLDGYKMSQIAEETGVGYKACENAVRRAKNKLKEYFNGMRESRKIREGKESIFSEEESRVLKSILDKIDGDMNESKDMNESESISGDKFIAVEDSPYVLIYPRDKEGGYIKIKSDKNGNSVSLSTLDNSIIDAVKRASGLKQIEHVCDKSGYDCKKYDDIDYYTHLSLKLKDSKEINESKNPEEDMQQYVDASDYEDTLSEIEEDTDSLINIIETTTDVDTYNEAVSQLSDLADKVWSILEEVEDHDIVQYGKKVLDKIHNAEDMEAPHIKSDPYAEVGMKRSDF